MRANESLATQLFLEVPRRNFPCEYIPAVPVLVNGVSKQSRRRAFWKTLCPFNDQTHQPLGFPPPFNRERGKRLDIPSMPCPHPPYSTPLIFHPSTQKAFPLLPAPPPPSVLQSPKNCMKTECKKRRVMARLVGALERRVEHLLLTAQSRERLAAQYVREKHAAAYIFVMVHVRAVGFRKSMPCIDPPRFIAWGPSQGGGFQCERVSVKWDRQEETGRRKD